MSPHEIAMTRSPSNDAYRHAVRYLEALLTLDPDRRIGRIDPAPAGPVGLKRCLRLLEHLGHPEKRLQFIHVTGTSGKGSVVTQLHAVLTRAGLRSGSYLSPHVTTPLERIAVGDGLLPPTTFTDLVQRLKPFLEAEYRDGPYGLPSYHEVMFSLALAAFVELGTDLAVIEVGIGGTLDSTNVIPPPRVAVVTDVGLDHTELLGPDVATIARDKAGIFKPGGVAITGARRLEAWTEIDRRARDTGLPLWSLDREVRLELRPGGFDVRWPGGELVGLEVGMGGAHQRRNAALSVAVVARLREQGLNIPDEAVRQGLLEAFLPGRFEAVQTTGGGVMVLDIAHNADKIEGLVDTWLARFGPGGAAMVALSADKDPDGLLLPLRRAFTAVVVTRPLAVPRRMASPRALYQVARSLGLEVSMRIDPRDGLELALELGNGRVAVTGSTYLVGEVRRLFQTDDEVLSGRRVRRLEPSMLEGWRERW
jgi:dihydrofolate synthase/folylpolyglutamate synthase